MIEKTGAPTDDELKKVSPSDERLSKGGCAILECFQRIPCDPCVDACPRGAIRIEGNINNIPVLDYEKCNGCGRCEDKCPLIGDSAIIISPHGEIRLSRGSYVDECRSQGLVFEDKDEGRNEFRLDDAELPFQAPDHSSWRN